MNKYGYILAMRLLQSDLVLDDEEIVARDYFLTLANSEKVEDITHLVNQVRHLHD